MYVEATLAHEMKHMYQFETIRLSFLKEDGGPGYLYDASDEQEAFRRQSYYDGDKSVRNMHENYKNLKDGTFNADILIKDIFKGYVYLDDKTDSFGICQLTVV